jgi:hypothetical protein
MFETVKPGHSTQREFVITLPISKDPLHPVGPRPIPGRFFVSSAWSAWPFYDNRGAGMRVRWKRFGNLLISRLQFNKVPIRLALPSDMQPCRVEPSSSQAALQDIGHQMTIQAESEENQW